MKTNRIRADLFAIWYTENKAYLQKILTRSYIFDEDILSDVFISIYFRILNKSIIIKDYTPNMLRAFKYSYLTHKRKSARLVLIEDYNHLQNICSLID